MITVQDCKVHRTPKIENKILVHSKIVKIIFVKSDYNCQN